MDFIKIVLLIIFLSLVSCSTLNSSFTSNPELTNDPSLAWENIDEVLAVVGDKPVLKSEVEKNYLVISRQKKITPDKINYEKSRVLDSIINFIIIENKANAEGIIVSKEKIDNQINDIMLRNNILTKEEFEKFIDKNMQMSLEDYKEDMRRSMIANLVMVYAVDYKRPTKEDAERLYQQKVKEDNRPFLQVKLKIIQVTSKDKSFQEEKAANTLINEVHKKAVSGTSFEKLAKEYSTDKASASNGGDLGWVLLGKLNPYIAGYAYQNMKKIDSISEVIKTENGYFIIKYLGRRIAPFEEFEQIMYNMISSLNGQKALDEWLNEQRAVSDVKIFMTSYQKK